VRRAFAKQVMAAAGVEDARVEAAFATVRPEDFLGPGPWPIIRWFRGYLPTPSTDPVYLYTDDLVGILPERDLNNGQPSLHAMLIAGAAPQEGEHVVHIGAGVGYYTAIFAELVGPGGVVTTVEFEPGLAARAAANFSRSPNVRVAQGDGAQIPFEPADVVYVNAGATRPAAPWLDGAQGARPADPAADPPTRDFAPMTRLMCVGAAQCSESSVVGPNFLRGRISGVAISPCEGARDAESERALAEALSAGGWERVTRFYWRDDLPAEQCWLRAPGWCLAYY
jgi:protein-L-isoaspartate(D-aspartate) O-methyltransferase